MSIQRPHWLWPSRFNPDPRDIEVDWDGEFAPGLVAAIVLHRHLGVATDLVTGARLSRTGTPTWQNGRHGGESGTLTTSNYWYLDNATTAKGYPASRPMTVLCVGSSWNTSANFAAACGASSTSGGTLWSFKSEQYNNTGAIGFTINGTTNFTSSLATPSNAYGVLVCSASPSQFIFGLNGQTSTTSDSTAFSLTPHGRFAIGVQAGTTTAVSDSSNSPIGLVALWTRAFTAEQVARLSLFPWPLVFRSAFPITAGTPSTPGGGSTLKTGTLMMMGHGI